MLKHKKRGIANLCRLLVLTAVLSLFMVSSTIMSVSSTPDTVFAVEPTNSIGKEGETFTVDVRVYDASYLYSWQVHMMWDEPVLNVSNVVFGGFLDVPREGSALTVDALEDQKIVNVTSGLTFEAGVNVVIKDDTNSETNSIMFITGNMLTMTNDLQHTYTVAAHGEVDPWPDISSSSMVKSGYFIIGESTVGKYRGVEGDGLLVSITFLVETATSTTLDITSDYTYYIEVFSPPTQNKVIDFPKENGYVVLPWVEDLNVDGIVDIFDISSVAIHWGETGPDGWIPEDLNKDGVVDITDLSMVAVKFGEQYAG